MASYNKILLLGNLTRDPQLSYTPNQTAVVDFGLATNRKYTSQDGSQREDTCFIDCRAFGRMAENLNKYTSKGKPIFIEGRLTFDTWTAQDGTKRSRHRVTVENFQFLPGGGGGGAGAGAGTSQGGQGYHTDSGAPQGPPMGGPGGPGDDIPF